MIPGHPHWSGDTQADQGRVVAEIADAEQDKPARV
jgi:hypothetical protein